MLPERTFWEKATAAHVFCMQDKPVKDRYARHWFDLTRLARAGYADKAVASPRLAKEVADHKSHFFVEKDDSGGKISYFEAISGAIRLVPDGDRAAHLRAAYEMMIREGLFVGSVEPFDVLMEQIKNIQTAINSAFTEEEAPKFKG